MPEVAVFMKFYPKEKIYPKEKFYLDFNALACLHLLHTSILFHISHWKTNLIEKGQGSLSLSLDLKLIPLSALLCVIMRPFHCDSVVH